MTGRPPEIPDSLVPLFVVLEELFALNLKDTLGEIEQSMGYIKKQKGPDHLACPHRNVR